MTISLRQRVIDLLEDANYNVSYWGRVYVERFIIVRPGGIINDRTSVEIWLINGAIGTDPDEGLAEWSDEVYDIIRHHLLEPNAIPGPPYSPTGKVSHSTMVMTGADPQGRGIGRQT